MKTVTHFLRNAAVAIAALAFAAHAAPSYAADCEQWHVAGSWSMKQVHSEDLVVMITMRQQGTTLSGDASSIVFKGAKNQKVFTDNGAVSGVVEGQSIKFQIAWHGRRSVGAYEGVLTGFDSGEWTIVGQTSDRWWAETDIIWKATLKDAGCAKAAIEPGMEYRTNRPGSDIARIRLQSTPDGDIAETREKPTGAWGPQVCARLCLAKHNCKAWTLVWAGVQDTQSVCYLKNPAPQREVNKCCVSGEVYGRTDEVQTRQPPPSTGQVVTPGMEDNTDRPGSDYHRDETLGRSDDPERCQAQCRSSQMCRAWTYVRPGVQGLKGVCYLKRAAPRAVPNTCCISGVMPSKTDEGGMTERDGYAPPPPPPPPGQADVTRDPGGIAGVRRIEDNTDRPGSDFTHILLDVQNPELCRKACVENRRCQAWTMVRAGLHGPTAVCYLKNPAPAPVANNCCISGTVTR